MITITITMTITTVVVVITVFVAVAVDHSHWFDILPFGYGMYFFDIIYYRHAEQLPKLFLVFHQFEIAGRKITNNLSFLVDYRYPRYPLIS